MSPNRNYLIHCKFSSFDGGACTDFGVLGCNTVYCWKWYQHLRVVRWLHLQGGNAAMFHCTGRSE
jgi:uncharacterized Fe-S cluster-containing radical SAM superfamily protein